MNRESDEKERDGIGERARERHNSYRDQYYELIAKAKCYEQHGKQTGKDKMRRWETKRQT